MRARVHSVRDTGKFAFLTLRQTISSVQCVVVKADNSDLYKWAVALPKETVVDVTGKLSLAQQKVLSVSQSDVELGIESIFVISAAAPLPFTLEDAARPESAIAANKADIEAATAAKKAFDEAAAATAAAAGGAGAGDAAAPAEGGAASAAAGGAKSPVIPAKMVEVSSVRPARCGGHLGGFGSARFSRDKHR